MSIKGALKKRFKATLESWGYEMRNLNRMRAENAVVYNTKEYADRFYANTKLMNGFREYVPQHLENLRVVLAEEGIVIRKNTAILDAGCGPGDCLKMLREERSTVVLISPEPIFRLLP